MNRMLIALRERGIPILRYTHGNEVEDGAIYLPDGYHIQVCEPAGYILYGPMRAGRMRHSGMLAQPASVVERITIHSDGEVKIKL